MTPEQLHSEARELFSLCCDLAEENRLLRRRLMSLLFAVAARRELIAYAGELIEQRWPDREEKAA